MDQALADVRMANRITFIPKLFPCLVIVLSGLALVGWQFDITLFKSLSSELVSMKANTAMSLILSAISLLMLQTTHHRIARRRLSKILSLIVILVGGVTLLEYFTGRNPGLDTLVFNESPGAFGTLIPGRMEPITAINLVLLGLASLAVESRQAKRHSLPHILASLVALIALLPAIGYLYGARFTSSIGVFSAMSPQTSLSFLLMATALSLVHIDHGLAAVIVSEGPGGSIARRILPAAILIPLFLGWLRILGERSGEVSAEFGTALFTAANIAGFFVVVWLQSASLQRTELRRRSLQQERDSLRIQSELREQFVAMLSHDLRTPLTAASSYAQLIRRYPDRGEFTKANAEKIVDSVTRSDRMIQDLLEVTRIRAGNPMHLTVAECDLAAIAQATVQELAVIHGGRIVYEGEQEIKGRWDPIAIRRAVENLCNNAIKYGAPGSPITVRAEHFGGRIRLSVHNQGIPIPKEEQKTLFEPFQRVSTAMNKGKKGWGLGLALVRGIAEAHGGRILVESSAENGTRFTIELTESIEQAIPGKAAS